MKNPIVRVRYPWWLRPFVRRDIMAITLGRRIYIAAPQEGAAFDRILRHELVHVRQAGECGTARFLWCYVAEYLRNRRSGLDHAAAYRAISFEVEAFAAERDQPL
jgi:Domain of unknown function (DUF4157)